MKPSTLSLIHQGRFPKARTLLERQLAADLANSMLLGQMGFLLHCLIETLRHHHFLVGNRPNKPTTGGSQTYS